MEVRTAAVLLAAIICIIAVPVSDGATEDDLRISIPELGYDSEVSQDLPVLSMDSNSTRDLSLYIFNDSESMVAAVFKQTSVTGTASVKPEDSSTDILPGSYAVETVKISINEYADTGYYSLPLVVYIQNLEDTSSVLGFTKTIILSLHVTSKYFSDNQYNKFFGVIPNTLDGILGEPWVAAAATMVFFLIANIAICYVAIPLLTNFARENVSKLEKSELKKSVTKIMSALIFVYSVNLSAQIIGAGPEFCHAMNAFSTFLYVCVGATLVWKIYTFIINALFKSVDGIDVVDGFDSSLIPLFKMVGQILISVCAIAAILASLGVDFAGILMSAGVVTLGITMGAQNILGQFFSGVVLLSTRPFKKGDFIKVSGTVYIVRKVKLMFTELYTWEADQIVTIPNNVLTSATIVNVTKESKEVRIYVYVSVAYEADIPLAKKLMIQAAMEHPHVIKDGSRTPPTIRFTDFLDSGIELRLAAYVDDFDNSGTFAGEMRERIFDLFKEEDVEIPYSKYEVTLMPCDGKKKPSDGYE